MKKETMEKQRYRGAKEKRYKNRKTIIKNKKNDT